jgi:type IX secretion system PorP/SprF family membrane protein
MMKKLFLHILLIPFLGAPAFGQLEPLLDLHQLIGLAINPAYAGSQDALNVGIHSRAQWTGFDGAPRTLTLSSHTPMKNKKVNLGLLVMGDRLGSKTETGILLNYAYRMTLGSGKLALGLAAGISHLTTDMDRIRYADEGDLLLQNPGQRFIMPEFSLGVYYHHDKYFLGFSMPFFMSHFTSDASAKYQFAFRPGDANYLLYGGYIFQASENIEIFPSALFRVNPANASQLDFHCDLIYRERFWLGANIRTNGQISALFQVQVNPQFRIGYSYGYELSQLSSYQHGSHEVGLQYNFRYTLNVVSPRFY